MFQSTPPVRGATADFTLKISGKMVSIHAPRAGGDLKFTPGQKVRQSFNPRPPCGGRPQNLTRWINFWSVSIHAPRAGGDNGTGLMGEAGPVSIHAPRAGGDRHLPAPWPIGAWCFNPRPPCGGRRPGRAPTDHREPVSIHAPRAGGDSIASLALLVMLLFQSTPPVRGATLPSGGGFFGG